MIRTSNISFLNSARTKFVTHQVVEYPSSCDMCINRCAGEDCRAYHAQRLRLRFNWHRIIEERERTPPKTMGGHLFRMASDHHAIINAGKSVSEYAWKEVKGGILRTTTTPICPTGYKLISSTVYIFKYLSQNIIALPGPEALANFGAH
jgi:hypothetical protein